MDSSENGVNVMISEKAASYIRSKRLVKPMVLVNIGFRLAGGGGSGCGCGGGGDEGDSRKTEEFLSTILLDGGRPGGDFVRIDTSAGIPVYLSDRVYDTAQKNKNTLIVNVKGLVIKKLSVEGLDSGGLHNQIQPAKTSHF